MQADAGVSIARRRALIKGLGKGVAIAGAATPLSSLATERLALIRANQAFICTISGNMSLLLSGAGGATIVPCSGTNITSYVSTNVSARSTTKAPTSAWPTAAVNAGAAPGDIFATCFGVPSTDVTKLSLLTLLSQSNLRDEAYWICALLNSYNTALKYPYTPAEVKAQYRAQQPGALAFHKLLAGYA